MPDKREQIIQRLRTEGLTLTCSSPAIKSFWIVANSQVPPKPIPTFEKVDMSEFTGTGDQLSRDNVLPDIGGVGEEILRQEELKSEQLGNMDTSDNPEDKQKEEPDIESMSPKEFKKYKKEKEREAALEQKKKEKEAKEFEAIRKDAHKRGYDTSVLMQLESPDQLYDFSDEEIDQIQAAGYINEDGFYDFVYPPDAEDLQKDPISTKKVLVVLGLVLFIGGMIAWFFAGVSGMF